MQGAITTPTGRLVHTGFDFGSRDYTAIAKHDGKYFVDIEIMPPQPKTIDADYSVIEQRILEHYMMQDVKVTEKNGALYVGDEVADKTAIEYIRRAGMEFIRSHFAPYERRQLSARLKDSVAVGALVAAQGWK